MNTIEEYVVNRLSSLEKEVADKNETIKMLCAEVDECHELVRRLKRYFKRRKMSDGENHYITCDNIYEVYDHDDYLFLMGVFGLEEEDKHDEN